MTPAEDLFLEKELGILDTNFRPNPRSSSEKQEKLPNQDGSQENESIGDDVQNESIDNNPVPGDEGNLISFLQVLGAFVLMFNSWGIANTFGAFQTYYESNLLVEQSPSNISWIGSIQAFLLLFIGGLCTGPIFDAGYVRELVIVGSLLSVSGMMMTSICQEYWYDFHEAVISKSPMHQNIVQLGKLTARIDSLMLSGKWFLHKDWQSEQG